MSDFVKGVAQRMAQEYLDAEEPNSEDEGAVAAAVVEPSRQDDIHEDSTRVCPLSTGDDEQQKGKGEEEGELGQAHVGPPQSAVSGDDLQQHPGAKSDTVSTHLSAVAIVTVVSDERKECRDVVCDDEGKDSCHDEDGDTQAILHNDAVCRADSKESWNQAPTQAQQFHRPPQPVRVSEPAVEVEVAEKRSADEIRRDEVRKEVEVEVERLKFWQQVRTEVAQEQQRVPADKQRLVKSKSVHRKKSTVLTESVGIATTGVVQPKAPTQKIADTTTKGFRRTQTRFQNRVDALGEKSFKPPAETETETSAEIETESVASPLRMRRKQSNVGKSRFETEQPQSQSTSDEMMADFASFENDDEGDGGSVGSASLSATASLMDSTTCMDSFEGDAGSYRGRKSISPNRQEGSRHVEVNWEEGELIPISARDKYIERVAIAWVKTAKPGMMEYSKTLNHLRSVIQTHDMSLLRLWEADVLHRLGTMTVTSSDDLIRLVSEVEEERYFSSVAGDGQYHIAHLLAPDKRQQQHQESQSTQIHPQLHSSVGPGSSTAVASSSQKYTSTLKADISKKLNHSQGVSPWPNPSREKDINSLRAEATNGILGGYFDYIEPEDGPLMSRIEELNARLKRESEQVLERLVNALPPNIAEKVRIKLLFQSDILQHRQLARMLALAKGQVMPAVCPWMSD